MGFLNSVVKSMIRWALTSGAVEERDFPIQQVQYLGKTGDSVLWSVYGFYASAPAGQPSLLMAMQGNAEARVHLPGSPKERPRDLASTEVCLFHPPTGTKITLRTDGTMEVVVLKDLTMQVTGDLLATVDGAMSVSAGSDATITAAGDVIITAGGDAVINPGGVVHLGGLGGKAVARVGDAITITPPEIAAGSANVFAVD